MNLDYFINLSAEVVDDVEKAALSADQHLANLALLSSTHLSILDESPSAGRVIKDFATSCIVKRNKLTWKEVTLHFEEADIFFTATD